MNDQLADAATLDLFTSLYVLTRRIDWAGSQKTRTEEENRAAAAEIRAQRTMIEDEILRRTGETR